MCSERISMAPSGLGLRTHQQLSPFPQTKYLLDHGDCIRKVLRRSLAAFGIERLHSVTTPSGLSTPQRGDCSHLDLDTEHTLTEKDVPHCVVHEIASRLTRVNHEPIGELHGFGTGGTEFSGDDDFASFGTGLHHKAEDTVARAVQGPSASHHEARRYAEVMHYTWRED